METAKERVNRIHKEALTRQTLLAVKVCNTLFDWLESLRCVLNMMESCVSVLNMVRNISTQYNSEIGDALNL